MDVTVDLECRELIAGTATIKLSNEDIRRLREIAGDSFDSTTATAIADDLIEDQIRPFLQTAGRPIDDSTIEQELEEAFQTHLYLYHQRNG